MRQNPQIIEANCNAHPRRKLKDAEAVQPVLAAEGGKFLSAMFEAEAVAKEQGLRGKDLLRWRQQTKPVTVRFWPGWIRSNQCCCPVTLWQRSSGTTESTGAAVSVPPNIPIDNSASERAFQPVAKLRLNSLFAGGTQGAHHAAVLLGIIGTCGRLDVDPEAYLTWLFVRRGTHRSKYDLPARELTPAAYKRAHPKPTA